MPDTFDLSEFLPFRLNRLADALSLEVMQVYRQRYDLSRPEWRVLAHLGSVDSTTASELIGLTAMDKVKTSRAIAALENRGWTVRQTDANDRRIAHVSLTEDGRAALNVLTPLMLSAEGRVTDALTPDALENVRKAIADLEKALKITT